MSGENKKPKHRPSRTQSQIDESKRKAKEAKDKQFSTGVAKQQWAGLEAIKDDIDYGPDMRHRKKHNHSKVKLMSKRDINP